MNELDKTMYANRRPFYGVEFASSPYITGVEEELVHLVQDGVIEMKKTPDAVFAQAARIHDAGIGAIRDSVTIEELRTYARKGNQAEWAVAIRRLEDVDRRAFMGAIGRLHQWGNRALFHSKLAVEHAGIDHSWKLTLGAPKTYVDNPDVKPIGWIRQQSLATLMSLDGVRLYNAILLKVSLGEAVARPRSSQMYLAE